jgi:hypothetical protein
LSAVGDTSAGSLINLTLALEREIARNSDLTKVKVERCRYLLFRRAQLQAKIDLINDELSAMTQEDQPK